MQVEFTDKDTGEKKQHDAPGLTSTILGAIADLDFSKEQVKATIDQLDISADAKSTIYILADVTIKVGSAIVKIGRKILDIIIGFFNQHPNIGFGAIFGAFIGFLFSLVPFFGQLLGPIVIPVFTAYGMVLGAKEELKDKELERKIRMSAAQFEQFS